MVCCLSISVRGIAGLQAGEIRVMQMAWNLILRFILTPGLISGPHTATVIKYFINMLHCNNLFDMLHRNINLFF